MKTSQLTIYFEKSENMFVGQIKEYPAAISQGKTMDELKENLLDALKLLLEKDEMGNASEFKIASIKMIIPGKPGQ